MFKLTLENGQEITTDKSFKIGDYYSIEYQDAGQVGYLNFKIVKIEEVK